MRAAPLSEQLAEAVFVAVLGYLSHVLSTTVGYLFFDEVPSLAFWIGAATIVAATVAVSPRLTGGELPRRPAHRQPPPRVGSSTR